MPNVKYHIKLYQNDEEVRLIGDSATRAKCVIEDIKLVIEKIVLTPETFVNMLSNWQKIPAHYPIRRVTMSTVYWHKDSDTIYQRILSNTDQLPTLILALFINTADYNGVYQSNCFLSNTTSITNCFVNSGITQYPWTGGCKMKFFLCIQIHLNH